MWSVAPEQGGGAMSLELTSGVRSLHLGGCKPAN